MHTGDVIIMMHACMAIRKQLFTFQPLHSYWETHNALLWIIDHCVMDYFERPFVNKFLK